MGKRVKLQLKLETKQTVRQNKHNRRETKEKYQRHRVFGFNEKNIAKILQKTVIY